MKAHAAEDKKAAAKKLAEEKMAEVEKEAAKADKQYDVHGADMVDHPELTHHKHKGDKHSHHDGAWPLYKPGETVVTPAQIQDALRGASATVGSNGRGEEIGNTGMFLTIGAWIAILFLIMKIARRGRGQGTQGGWFMISRRGKKSSGDLERLERAEKSGYLG